MAKGYPNEVFESTVAEVDELRSEVSTYLIQSLLNSAFYVQ